jgi:hypothetical protein
VWHLIALQLILDFLEACLQALNFAPVDQREVAMELDTHMWLLNETHLDEQLNAVLEDVHNLHVKLQVRWLLLKKMSHLE